MASSSGAAGRMARPRVRPRRTGVPQTGGSTSTARRGPCTQNRGIVTTMRFASGDAARRPIGNGRYAGTTSRPRRDNAAWSAYLASPRARSERLEPHEILFHEDDRADHVYEVASGTVILYRLLSDGRRQVVDILGAGDLFGLSATGFHDCSAESLTAARRARSRPARHRGLVRSSEPRQPVPHPQARGPSFPRRPARPQVGAGTGGELPDALPAEPRGGRLQGAAARRATARSSSCA